LKVLHKASLLGRLKSFHFPRQGNPAPAIGPGAALMFRPRRKISSSSLHISSWSARTSSSSLRSSLTTCSAGARAKLSRRSAEKPFFGRRHSLFSAGRSLPPWLLCARHDGWPWGLGRQKQDKSAV